MTRVGLTSATLTTAAVELESRFARLMKEETQGYKTSPSGARLLEGRSQSGASKSTGGHFAASGRIGLNLNFSDSPERALSFATNVISVARL